VAANSSSAAGAAASADTTSADTTPADTTTAETAAAGSAAADTPSDAQGTSLAEVVVTGSHIERSDFNSPQPISAISEESLEAAAPSNIANFASTIPAIRGSATPDNSNGALSNGEAGVAALNLRNLGTNRTLVLVNGNRWAPSTIEDLVDVNTIPQSLIKGIDVTTGGASAAYGSGAVGGVVNFILDTKYSGVKSSFQYGEDQDYGNPTRKFDLTAGAGFAGGRGHVLFSGELFSENGTGSQVPTYDKNGYFAMANSTANIAAGGPQYIVGNHIGISTYAPGGLITAGPLKGTYFGVNGTVNQLAYGNPLSGQWMQGGDWALTDSGQFGADTLSPQQKRESVYGRVSFDLTDSAEIYTEFTYARYQGEGFYDSPTTTGLTIHNDNPYLPASVAGAMAADGLSTFTLGTSNAYFGPSGSDNTRDTFRYMVGGEGHFPLLGMNWKWDTHAQLGVTNTKELETDTYNTANFTNAIDAVTNPATGQIVCRSTLTTPGNGCVPINILGTNLASPAALNYVLGTPERHERFELDEGVADFSTNDVPGWAGPISVALGAEGRREKVSGYVDPQYEAGWKYGNYVPTIGSYTVAEGYLETVIPIYKGLDFNGAGRYTSYSTSGGVKSWKLGLTYTPIPDVTLRYTRSADIRAGNLGELYSPGTARTNSVLINGTSDLFVQRLVGSTALQPETAKTNVYGVVFQPTFIPHFQASADFYDIEISKVISNLTAQQEADACYLNHIQQYCADLVSAGGVLQTIFIYYQNLNSVSERGLDLEASYQMRLDDVWDKLGGNLTLHAIGTHYITYTVNNGVTAINVAGSNTGDTPSWVYRMEAMYNYDTWALDLVGRGVSAGNLNNASNSYIQCTTGCPKTAGVVQTINYDHAAGAIFFDATITKKIPLSDRLTGSLFFTVKNVLNKSPPLVANPSTASVGAENTVAFPQTNTDLYDYLGRVWTLGARVEFK
jgi:iron complex outermembrane receptor protein